MKKFIAVGTLALGIASTGFAAQFKGFVEDTMCSTKAEMKDNAECAQKCIKAGSPAVLVTADGKIYKIAEQEKITSFAGKNVTVTGTLKGDTLSIDKVQ